MVFWRQSNESLARHRNPIFDRELGVTPATCIAIDTLHAIFLGILNRWCKVIVDVLVASGVYGAVGTTEENTIASIMILRSTLTTWYSRRHSNHPAENLSRLSDLTPKMVGARGEKTLHRIKGAECWGLALFLVAELLRFGARLGDNGRRLLAAGESLVGMIEVWKRCGRVMDRADIEHVMELYRRHMDEIRPFDIYAPKHHLVWHLIFNTSFHGNQNFYSNWLDEALNKILKASCRFTSQQTFDVSVLLRMKEHLSSRARRRPAP